MTGRTVILSDLHLGRPRCSAGSAEALRPIWQGSETLIINGDVAEVHHPDHWLDAARATMRLFDMCDADGVELTLLSGNHDPFLSDVRHLHVHGGQVFITHGDVLHPAVAPWSPAGARIRTAHAAALEQLDPDIRGSLEARLSVSQHASAAEWLDLPTLREEARRSTLHGMFIRPWAIVKVLHYWRIAPRLAAEFIREHAPGARFMVMGHTHRAGVWHVRGRVVINTGSFGFPGRPRAVVIENDRLSFHALVRTGETYSIREPALRTYALEPESAEAEAPITTEVV